MNSSEAVALVTKAIMSGVTGCCEWDEREAVRVREDTNLLGLTPEYIRQRLLQFVARGGHVKQVRERRARYGHRDYYYKAIIEEPGFKYGLFVEMELTDSDSG